MRYQSHNREGHQDHGRHMEEFKRKFWVPLILTASILLLFEMIQAWLGFILEIPFQKEILFLLSLVVYMYGGWPFIKGMAQEIKRRQPGMMAFIGTVISVVFFHFAGTVFVTVGKDFFGDLPPLSM